MSGADFRNFSTDGKDKKETRKLSKRWWSVDEGERASAIISVVTTLISYDTARQQQYQLSAKLYGNVDLLGVYGLSTLRIGTSAPAARERAYFNVVQSGIDTLVSKQAKNKPKPLFLTSGGDWKTQRKAKKLDKFVDGIFYENEIAKLRNLNRRDAYVFGDGLVQVYAHHDRVRFRRVLPTQLYVDWLEALSGKALQLHYVDNMDREVLCDLFKDNPEAVAKIREANSSSENMIGTHQNVADQVTVIESWRLPSGPDAGDGRHCITLVNAAGENESDGYCLEDEAWEKDFFPFAQRSWCKRLSGHWSQGIPEQIQGIQLELNRMSWVENRSYHLMGTFKLWTYTGSKIPKGQLNNEIGTVISGDKKPEYIVAPPVPPGYAEKRRELKQDAFEQIGISQLSANAQKPAGLDSGRALREFNNIESDRFMADGQGEEEFILDLSRLSVDCAKDIYKDKKSYKVKVPGRKFIESIDWKEIALEEDAYVMKIFPVSSLPQDPEGRLNTIQEYIQGGMLDPVTGKRLLDFPDLDQHETLANAMEDWINMVLEKIVDGDGSPACYTAPDPDMKLDLALWFALMYYAQGQCNRMPEPILNQLRNWMTQVKDLMAKAAPPPPVQPIAGQPGGGAPQAAPMPLPQSDIVQNTPAMAGA